MTTSAGPLFLLTTHRSGGTALARLFNVHPDIVVWGEHGGIINKLAETAEIIRRHPKVASPVGKRGIDKFLENKATLTEFSPWMNPVEAAGFLQSSRDLLNRWFGHGLRDGQRWGVKEIRYHSVETARFLLDLYPDARFVILRRKLPQQCVSVLLSKWTTTNLGDASELTEAEATQVIEDCAYALAALDYDLRRVAKVFPSSTMVAKYADLTADNTELMATLFGFAGLKVTPTLIAAASDMLSVKSGVTPKTESNGFMTREFMEQRAPDAVKQAVRSIRLTGVDTARLRQRRGPGKYSFIVGDSRMRNSRHSSLF